MKRYSIYIITALFIGTLISGSCKDDELRYEVPGSSGDGIIRIGASVSEALSTRSYIADGPVTSGKFTLFYPYGVEWKDGTDAYGMFFFRYNYGEVNFGFSGEETTGFVNVGFPTAPKEFIWSEKNSTGTNVDDGMIDYPRTKGSPVFLDNMPFTRLSETSLLPSAAQVRDSVLTLTDSNPFVPGVFDSENGSNDLLWGTTLAFYGADHIQFPMSHRMTRLKVNVEVDNTKDEDGNDGDLYIDLSRAKVYINGLLLTPKTYLRKYGELTFRNKVNSTSTALEPSIDPDLYKTRFYLVGNSEGLAPEQFTESDFTEVISGEDKGWTWTSKPDDLKYEVQTYTTEDFVFVPQQLLQGSETRPRLVIAVPFDDVNKGLNPEYEGQDYITFSGNIPYTMNVADSDAISTYTFDFLRGYEITLTTKMKPGVPDLEFAPVTVQPWVWKGTFNPEARQSGIFNAADFYAMVEYYKENNTFWLGRYGYISNTSTGNWIFQFNSGNVQLEVDKIMGMMHPNTEVTDNLGETSKTPPFTFDFRNRVQSYIMPNGQVIDMGMKEEATLMSIVTADRNKGVTVNEGETDPTKNTFAQLIAAYQVNAWQQMIYGKFTYADPAPEGQEQKPGRGTWTFRISEDITLDYNNIVASMIPSNVSYLSDFSFEFDDGVTVTIDNYRTEGATETLTADTDGEETLYEIVTHFEAGLYSSEEFMTLMSNYTSELDIERYGVKDGDDWTFPVWRNFTLNSADIQGGMIVKENTTYQFKLQGYTVTLIQPDRTTASATAQDLYTLLNLNEEEGIDDTEGFMQLIEYYNDYDGAAPEISTYGFYCIDSPRWVFRLNENITLDYNEIAGMMIPEDNQKLPFSFDFNYHIIFLENDPDNDTDLDTQLFGDTGQKRLLEILSPTKEPEESDSTEP